MAVQPAQRYSPGADGQPLLRIAGLAKRFGSLAAVAGVDLVVNDGELCALIGPNGAGKSTLFNVVSGHLRPDAGSVWFAGHRIDGLAPDAIARRGVARTFQTCRLFGGLAVWQNLALGILARRRLAGRVDRHAHRDAETIDEARHLAGLLGLADLWHRPAYTLSHAARRVLEVGMALALKPRLLLLDEPTAGLSPAETSEMTDLLRRLHLELGMTQVVIEHDMAVVFSLAQRVVVMHQGRLIADGPPHQVRADPVVQAAYLGEGV